MKKFTLITMLGLILTSCHTINTSCVQTSYDKNIKTVVCVDDFDKAFLAPKTTYKTYLDLKPGDRCVVRNEWFYGVVRVVKVNPAPRFRMKDCRKYGWITNKVDTASIEAMIEKDKKDAATIEREAIAKRHMETSNKVKQVFGLELKLNK